MRKSEISRKLIVAFLAFFGLSIGLTAQPWERCPRSVPENHHRIDMLNLSEEQQAEIKQIRLDRAKETQALRDELKINRAEINALIHKDNPDMKEITGLVEANGRIMTQIRIKEIDSRIKIRALLSDEQKVIYDAREGQMRRHRELAERLPQRRFSEKRNFR